MAGNQVTLTFAGDTAKLEHAFDSVGASARKMENKVDHASDSFDRAGSAADEVDTKAMGFRDTLTGVQDTAGGVSKIMKGDLFGGFLTLGAGIGDLGSGLYNTVIPGFKAMVKWLKLSKIQAAAMAVWSGIVKIATAAWAGVQWLLNVAMSANPIGLIIIAILVLVGIIVLIATKTDWFQRLWKVAWDGIKAAALAVWDFLKAIGAWFAGPFVDFFKNAWKWIQAKFTQGRLFIKDKINDVISFFKSIPSRIGAAFSKLGDAISWPFRKAFNLVSSAWNSTIGKLHWSIPSWVPVLGGRSISAPTLPHFHSGGKVPGPPGSEMLAVLEAGETVTPPGGGGTSRLTVDFGGVSGNLDRMFATWFSQLVRDGVITLRLS